MMKELFLDAISQGQEDMVHADLRTIYGKLDEAVRLWVRETKGLTASTTISTVADQQAYDLPADFMKLYVRERTGSHFNRRFILKYSYDDNTAWPKLTSYEQIFRADYTDAKDVPASFAIIDKSAAPAALTGTTTADGALAAGKTTLTDSAASFSASTLAARDTVYNVTRKSSGFVLTVTDANNLVTALFPEGLNSWNSGDSYRIQPAARKQIYLDAPSAQAGHSIIVPYIAVPPPVFAENDAWRLDYTVCRAVVYEAAFLFSLSKKGMKANQAHHQIFMDELKAERYRLARRRIEGR
jgi:hypothetical protein